MAGLVVAVVGTIAGMAGAWYARVAVTPIWHKKQVMVTSPPPPPAPGPGPAPCDVFVSYSRQDAGWVDAFTARLRKEGIQVASDEVVRTPGGRIVHAVEQAILDSAHGLLVFSQASRSDGWVDLQYGSLIQRAAETGQRFIPVLIEDVELPLFAKNFFYADFRNATRSRYDQRINELVEVLRP